MRHAQEHWLRLQAEAAIAHATSGDEKIAIDTRAVMHTSGSMQPTNIETLTNAYSDTKHNAAIRLIEMEMLHRQIVKQGGRI